MSFRLINPCKANIAKISKYLLDNIDKILILSINVKQWKNAATVKDWFKNPANKNQCSFIQFDVGNLYLSIFLNLFNEAIQYASTFTEIPDNDKTNIKHSRKRLLFYNNQPWEKKSGKPDFDVLLGCLGGAEICELLQIFALNKLSNIVDKNNIDL